MPASKFVIVQKYITQAAKDQQVYLKALAAYEAEKKFGVPVSNTNVFLSICCLSSATGKADGSAELVPYFMKHAA